MSAINLSFQHGRTQEQARACLADAVTDVRNRFGSMVQRVEWSAGGDAVHLSGVGFEVDARVDAHEVHVTGDIPLLGQLLGGPFAEGLRQIVQHSFQKRLT